MMTKVASSKEPIGLLAWHPDRLARNSIDGGQIIYSIDISKIVSLRFPTFWFEPTPQGLFMLQVAFGQSKYYSDNLSENVKRGIRQKLRRGWESFWRNMALNQRTERQFQKPISKEFLPTKHISALSPIKENTLRANSDQF